LVLSSCICSSFEVDLHRLTALAYALPTDKSMLSKGTTQTTTQTSRGHYSNLFRGAGIKIHGQN
jgi:hypothetical protein